MRHVLLAALTVGVFAMGVYLFVQVRSTPARADGTVATPPPEKDKDHEQVTKAAPHPPTPAPGSATPAPVHASEPPPQVPTGGGGDDDDTGSQVANPKLESVMDQANKAYDWQDFEAAKEIAAKVLAKEPTNIRMMRIMVSASCIDGDTPQAEKYYPLLPKADRAQMKARCDKYGVSFKEPAQ